MSPWRIQVTKPRPAVLLCGRVSENTAFESGGHALPSLAGAARPEPASPEPLCTLVACPVPVGV